jgi:hypothetical protein
LSTGAEPHMFVRTRHRHTGGTDKQQMGIQFPFLRPVLTNRASGPSIG